MRFSKLFLVITFWLTAVGATLAQGRLTGVVQDSTTHEPLSFASVFLANTTLGATTDENGKFTFDRVPAGTYDIVGSYVGYRLAKQNLKTGPGLTVAPITLRLASTGNQLGEVVVKGNPNRERDYERFLDLFLGGTTFSKQCHITNPDDVEVTYDEKTKDLTASAEKFVQVDNDALGYRIKYYGLRFESNLGDKLTSFDGQPAFEAMTPRDERQQQLWETNRATAYRGSLTHFLKSVYDNRVKEEGFLAQQVRVIENPRFDLTDSLRRLLLSRKGPYTKAEQDSLRRWAAAVPATAVLLPASRPIDSLRRVAGTQVFLRFTQELQVAYFGETPDPKYLLPMAYLGKPAPGTRYPAKREVSRIRLLEDEVEIQPNGSPVNAFAVSTSEYWGFEKIGELLPLDYVPAAATTTALPATPAAASSPK